MRPLIAGPEASQMEQALKAMANATRLRILHALALHPDATVTEICNLIGMKPQAVSNQLQKLAAIGAVSGIRSGLNIRYRITDERFPALYLEALNFVDEN